MLLDHNPKPCECPDSSAPNSSISLSSPRASSDGRAPKSNAIRWRSSWISLSSKVPELLELLDFCDFSFDPLDRLDWVFFSDREVSATRTWRNQLLFPKGLARSMGPVEMVMIWSWFPVGCVVRNLFFWGGACSYLALNIFTCLYTIFLEGQKFEQPLGSGIWPAHSFF